MDGDRTTAEDRARVRRASGRARARRRAWLLTTTLVAGSLVALGPVGADPAAAAPADDCAAPTRTVAGSTSGTALDVAAGEVVLLTGTQSGGVNTLPAGATLCVAAGATLRPAYMNNAAGTLYVAPTGTLTMPSVAVGAGFVLEDAGTATFAGLNVNGPGTLHVLPGATLTVTSQFTPGAGTVLNEGTLTLPAGASLNSGVTLSNAGTLTAGASVTVNGPFENSGTTRITGDLVVNGSGGLTNLCVLVASGSFTNNGPGGTSTGLVAIGGQFTNPGVWRQSATGALTAATLVDDGTVAGFGRYVFTGATSAQGTFAGGSAARPIVIDVPRTSPPYFDVVTNPMPNVVRADLTLPAPDDYPAPDCADPAAPASADLLLTKSGPVSVEAGENLTYTVEVTDAGPDDAADVVVTDQLPTGFVVTGTVPTADEVTATTVVWRVASLTAGGSLTFQVTGVAPATGPLVNTASVAASTADPDPSSNEDTVSTAVRPPDAPGPPPVADDLLREGVAGRPIFATVTGSSAVPDVRLQFRLVSGPSDGRLALTPSGFFLYLPDSGFLGEDQFVFEVCDNQDPVQCDQGTVTLLIHPRAVNDETTTPMSRPVTVPVAANDTVTAVPSTTLVAGPSHGGASVDPAAGTITYQPAPNYLGTDELTYRTCAPSLPSDCADAIVTVHVVPDNSPPVAPVLSLATTVGADVVGTPAVSDPDDDALTLTGVFDPVDGTAGVTAASLGYRPEPGYAGRDLFFYTVCDDGLPVLCSTGLVTVLVNPVPADDDATTPGGTPVDVEVTGNDLGSTVRPPAVQDPPVHGTVTQVGGTFTYTPEAGFTGVDTFTYRVCSTDLFACADATVTIVVTAVVTDPGGGTGGTGSGSSSGGATTTGGGSVLATTGADGRAPAGLAVLLLGAGALLVLGARAPLVQARRRARTTR